jgi:hypothetical protein
LRQLDLAQCRNCGFLRRDFSGTDWRRERAQSGELIA